MPVPQGHGVPLYGTLDASVHGSAVRVSLWQAVCCECGSRDAITRCGSDRTGSGSSIVETAGNVVGRTWLHGWHRITVSVWHCSLHCHYRNGSSAAEAGPTAVNVHSRRCTPAVLLHATRTYPLHSTYSTVMDLYTLYTSQYIEVHATHFLRFHVSRTMYVSTYNIHSMSWHTLCFYRAHFRGLIQTKTEWMNRSFPMNVQCSS